MGLVTTRWMTPEIIIFLLTYAGVALGGIPGLVLDRTGIALLGAIAMVVSGAISLNGAVLAIDVPTILLLYALMVLSAQLRLGGFYTWVALRITRLMNHPGQFLLILMLVSAVLSSILANDIVCLAFTPVLTISLLKAGLNPIPFLIGLAVSSNIGSAATIIGNPQNMLIGQAGKLNFGHFMFWCTPPSLISLLGAFLLIRRMFHNRFKQQKNITIPEVSWPELNGWQSAKGLFATAILMVLFFTPIPREMTALSIAGILLCSRRMATRTILELIDWHLITLFCALFIVIQSITQTNLPTWVIERLAAYGFELTHPMTLTVCSVVLSNLVSNVPATMLISRFLDASTPEVWYILAVSSTFAGNLITIGSIANLIVFEQAHVLGVDISFTEHAKIGIPVTLLSLGILVVWIYV